jgi:hypothetical protein
MTVFSAGRQRAPRCCTERALPNDSEYELQLIADHASTTISIDRIQKLVGKRIRNIRANCHGSVVEGTGTADPVLPMIEYVEELATELKIAYAQSG